MTPQAATEDEGFSLKANALTREVTATMRVEDGAALEMVIKLPLSWPLKTADVECRRTVRQQRVVLESIKSQAVLLVHGEASAVSSCCLKALM